MYIKHSKKLKEYKSIEDITYMFIYITEEYILHNFITKKEF